MLFEKFRTGRRTRRAGAAVAILVAGVATFAPTVAKASAYSGAVTSDSSEIQVVREKLAAHGASEAQQESLLTKLANGVAWDAQTGASPTSTISSSVDGYTMTTKQFSDGSYVESKAQLPKPSTTSAKEANGPADSVDSCTLGSGVGSFPFSGCHVATDQAFFTIDFFIDGQTSQINQTSVTSSDLAIAKSGGSESLAIGTLYATMYGGGYSQTLSLTAHVTSTITDTSP
jgi:hypothetical protein